MTVTGELINTGNWYGDTITVERASRRRRNSRLLRWEHVGTIGRGEGIDLTDLIGETIRLVGTHSNPEENPDHHQAGEVNIIVDAPDRADPDGTLTAQWSERRDAYNDYVELTQDSGDIPASFRAWVDGRHLRGLEAEAEGDPEDATADERDAYAVYVEQVAAAGGIPDTFEDWLALRPHYEFYIAQASEVPPLDFQDWLERARGHFETYVSNVQDEGGTPLGFLGWLEDVAGNDPPEAGE